MSCKICFQFQNSQTTEFYCRQMNDLFDVLNCSLKMDSVPELRGHQRTLTKRKPNWFHVILGWDLWKWKLEVNSDPWKQQNRRQASSVSAWQSCPWLIFSKNSTKWRARTFNCLPVIFSKITWSSSSVSFGSDVEQMTIQRRCNSSKPFGGC